MKKNDLHQLIHSMSASEKRYFNIYSKRHTIGETNNYILLYKVIEQRKENYDEASILLKFEKLKLKTRFPVLKSYLYEMILQSLNAYHKDSSINSKIAEMIKSVEILYKKGLYKQCDRLIKKAWKIIRKYELYTYKLDLLSWEKKVMGELYLNKLSKEKLTKLIKEEQNTIDNLSTLRQYQNVSLLIFSSVYKNGYQWNNTFKKISSIIGHPLNKLKENQLSDLTKIHYYNIYAEYYRVNGDYLKYYKTAYKLFKLIDNPLIKIQLDKKQIISIYFTYIIACYYSKKYEIALTTLKKLMELKVEQLEEKARIFIRSHQIELAVLIKQKKYVDFDFIEKSIVEGLKKYDSFIESRHKVALHFLIFNLLFIHGKYKKSLYWINKVLNDYKANLYREDIIINAKLAYIVLHYQLKNFELVNYLIQSYKRDYKHKNAKLIKLLWKLNNQYSNKLSLLKEIMNLFKENSILLEYFDWLNWAQANSFYIHKNSSTH